MALGFSTLARILSAPTPGGVPRQIVVVSVLGDGASYAAGGFAVTAATVGLTAIDTIVPIGGGAEGAAGAGFGVSFDTTNAKVKCWKGAGSAVLTEIAAGDWTSSQKVTLLVIGQ